MHRKLVSSCVVAAEPMWLSKDVFEIFFERSPWNPEQVLRRASEEVVAPSAIPALLEEWSSFPRQRSGLPRSLLLLIFKPARRAKREYVAGRRKWC